MREETPLPGQEGDADTRRREICRRNIRAMMVFQTFSSVAWAAMLGPVFDKYLLSLGSTSRGPQILPRQGRNLLVGFAESLSGITCLVVALPVGYLVDRRPDKRAVLLRFSAWLGLVASFLAVVGVVTDVSLLTFAMLILMGFFSELSSSASEAIFADSIPQGERSALFTTKGILNTIGNACGPACSAVCLLVAGSYDKWQPHQIKIVIISGTLMMPACCASLYFFQDPPQAGSSLSCADADAGSASPAAAAQGGGAPEGSGATNSDVPLKRCGPLRPKHVPVILALADFLTCIGAGMTVKFFNLFFIEDMKFTPLSICGLQIAYPLVIAVFMKFSQRVAKPLGRAQASLLFFSSNVLCLFLMSQVQSLPLLLAVFLIRGGFANSVYPIDRSILMDFTPSSQRGMWNAVQSLTSMTWSGSALLGGLLSDSRDYRFTFLITAFVYAIACVLYSPLLGLVPRRETDAKATGAVANGGGAREVLLAEGTTASAAPPVAPVAGGGAAA